MKTLSAIVKQRPAARLHQSLVEGTHCSILLPWLDYHYPSLYAFSVVFCQAASSVGQFDGLREELLVKDAILREQRGLPEPPSAQLLGRETALLRQQLQRDSPSEELADSQALRDFSRKK